MAGARQGCNALLVGWRGGVGQALVRLAASEPWASRLRMRFDRLLLLDQQAGEAPTLPPWMDVLPPQAVRQARQLQELIVARDVCEVIEVASVGTMDCVAACDAVGANYVTAGIEIWPSQWDDTTDPNNQTMHLARTLIPGHRPVFDGGSYLIGAGMNPGAVNALTAEVGRAFARHVGVTVAELDIRSVLITEIDTVRYVDRKAGDGEFWCSWCPPVCLQGFQEPRAMYMDRGQAVALPHAPAAVWYGARCATQEIRGMVVPHEELVTLAARFPDVELAYIYRPGPDVLAALANGDPNHGRRFKFHRIDPATADVTGTAAVGVLACSRAHGEYWLGFETQTQQAKPFACTATEFQVAAGVVAGWALLGQIRGLHTVEDLDASTYLRYVEEVLGATTWHHDPSAPPKGLRDRRC